MKKLLGTLALFFVVGSFLIPTFSRRSPKPKKNPEKSPRSLVHLLDYLAVEYGGAVKNGKILSLSEYKEQTEFAKTAMDLSQNLTELKEPRSRFWSACRHPDLVQSRSKVVTQAAREAQGKVIQWVNLTVTPTQWPNLASGRHLFQNTCAKCHGPEGRAAGPPLRPWLPNPLISKTRPKCGTYPPFKSSTPPASACPIPPWRVSPIFPMRTHGTWVFMSFHLVIKGKSRTTPHFFNRSNTISK